MKLTKNSHSLGTERFIECQTNKRPDPSDRLDSPDDDLVNLCRSGDMGAFGQLVERYQDRLFNAVIRMVGNYDDALEITQEAFYRAMKGLKSFRGNAGFFTWLYRIGINLCINHHRRNKRVRISSLQPHDEAIGRQADALEALARSQEPLPEKNVQLKETHTRALTALEALEPDARAVVILRDIEQLNYAQIAGILELPVGTVKSRLARARKSLRDRLL